MRQFGIGILGAAIIARPRIFAALAAFATLGAFAAIAGGLAFNGDVSDLLRADTPGYRALQKVEKDFHTVSSDEVLVVESKGFDQPSAYRSLEAFVSALSGVAGVAAITSIFSYSVHGLPEPYLGSAPAGLLPPGERLARLLDGQALAGNILSKDLKTTIVILATAPGGETPSSGMSAEDRREIERLAARHDTSLSITFGGMREIHRAIETALRKDQRMLAAASTLLCVLLSLLIFRSWRGALICAIPPVTGVLWFFGFAAMAGIAINPITAIIPTLIIVVGFANSVHLHFACLRLREESPDHVEAVRRTMRETGPACFMTSLTTGVSFLGIGAAGSDTLNAFAIAGFFGLLLQFLAVLLCFPLLAVTLLPAERPTHVPDMAIFALVGRGATALLGFGRPVILASIGLLGLLLLAHFSLPTGFQLSEHLRSDDQLARLQQRLAEKGLGSAYLHLVVHDSDGIPGVSDADLSTFAWVGAAFHAQGAAGGPSFSGVGGIDRQMLENPALAKRFVAADGLSYLFPIPIDPTLPADEIERIHADADARLVAAGLEGRFEIVGMPLLSAREVPAMIRDLQLGFLLSLLLVVLLLVYATGSVWYGILSLVPNLIPILGVEAVLFVMSAPLTMTAAVALTIAFGIAVDNSIHLLSLYQRFSAADAASRLRRTVDAIALPITATTLLLVAGLLVTQASSLPTVAVFGQLVTAAMVFAMISSLYLLPAFLEPRHPGGRDR